MITTIVTISVFYLPGLDFWKSSQEVTRLFIYVYIYACTFIIYVYELNIHIEVDSGHLPDLHWSETSQKSEVKLLLASQASVQEKQTSNDTGSFWDPEIETQINNWSIQKLSLTAYVNKWNLVNSEGSVSAAPEQMSFHTWI